MAAPETAAQEVMAAAVEMAVVAAMAAKVIESIFPQELASSLASSIASGSWNHGWRSNTSMGYGHWNQDLANGESWNGLDVSRSLRGPFKEAWDYISSVHLNKYRLIRCYANAHTHGVEGYPHTDSIRKDDLTLVCYLNREWKREWGGETVIFEGDNISMAQLPKFNRGILFHGADWHCARGVSRICPELRQTLMFKCAPEGIDLHRDALQKLLNTFGAYFIKHRNGVLTRHLMATYDLLKRSGQPDGVCMAGGAHSVFGTSTFKEVCIDRDHRQTVEQAIGYNALHLVDLFSSIKRAHQLDAYAGQNGAWLELFNGGNVSVSKIELDALCMIECANLFDQDELGQWPRLSQMWKEANS
ncbi:DUF6817 domain-containing protein [Polynucleobacter sp. UK-Kesae-W10]|uniref:DUF6817 domain-containing protein n=1 Tax=Polynucleobacter sp. UK-Kesae-W10 TaxID=1819738 RepID=UPI001C0CEEF5|nr:2OG-Fe(II) oxygenase [Polynucleobacter sp. UK-Kesae-W10]MBU3577599.1 2OG-Fe(II) oxygenase [Polynucleobacter sp. UK-Kesae-W10]